jgi:hypothetical protein
MSVDERTMPNSRSFKPGLEKLEDRRVLAASIVEFNDIGYFFDSSSTAVGRYDLTQSTWLTPITLLNATTGPQAAHVDADGIYVGFGKTAYRYNSTGTVRTHLINLPSVISAIHTDGNLLFLNYSIDLYARLVSINKNSNTLIDTQENYVYAVAGSSIAPSRNTIYGRSLGISPADITYVTYTDDGRFTAAHGDSPYHGAYPSANRTWVFPDESKVVDDAGIIYATSNLTYANRLSPIQDIDFYQSQLPFVLNGKEITAYSRAYLPTGSVTLDAAATKIFVTGDLVIAFFPESAASNGYRTQSIPIADFKPADPNEPIDPTGLAYLPDWTSVSTQGQVLLLSKAHQSIFRWNPTTLSYDPSISLLGTPSYITYARESETIYVLYASGLIYKIDLKEQKPKEFPFFQLPGQPAGLSMAGEFIFAVDNTGAWRTHYTISPDGVLKHSRDWNYYSKEYVWNSTNNRMYFFRDDTSPNDLLFEAIGSTGTLQTPVDSPYHGDIGWEHPIRLSGDGRWVLLGSGLVLDAQTLNRSPYGLANKVTDALWFAGRWITLRTILAVPQLQEWTGPTLELTRVVQLEPGFAHSLHRLTNKHMLVISVPFDGIPAFTILDQQLQASSINIRWHNPMNPKDVDDDQTISPLDVLRIIDQINKYGARQIENVGEIFCDVDDDGSISPLDVLFVIDWLNSKSGGQGEGESNRANQESVVESLFAGEIDWFSHSVSDEFGQCQIGRIKRPGRSSNR